MPPGSAARSSSRPFTFVATAHALQWQGITPVFCDIDPLTHNIDADRRGGADHTADHGDPRESTSGAVPCAVEALTEIAAATGSS